jgi:hypothetical protein
MLSGRVAANAGPSTSNTAPILKSAGFRGKIEQFMGFPSEMLLLPLF